MFGMLYSIKGLVAALGSKVVARTDECMKQTVWGGFLGVYVGLGGVGCRWVVGCGGGLGKGGWTHTRIPTRFTSQTHTRHHTTLFFKFQSAPTSDGLTYLRTNAYTLHHYEVHF